MTRFLRHVVRRAPFAPLLANVADSGVQFLGHVAWLDRTQWHAPERLKEIQEDRLRSLIGNAYRHSSYYRNQLQTCGLTPEDIRGLDDLGRLPILARQSILDHFADIVAANSEVFRPVPSTTGGTSGQRIQFLRDRTTTSIGNAARWRTRGWHGVGFHSRIAEVRGFRLRSGALDRSTAIGYGPGVATLQINTVRPDQTNLELIAKEMARFKPEAVTSGSATWLAFFAQYMLEHSSAHRIRPKVVFTGGERLFPRQRRVIAEAFDAPVVDGYGNWEYVAFGGECAHGRMHLATEIGIVEIVKDGKRCAPGEVGDVVVTSLWNQSFPFIRYAIGDLASLDTDACPCGRGLPTWQVVGGRERSLLASPNGPLYVTAVLGSSRWYRKIAGVRFYQDRRDAVVVQIVRGPAFVEEDIQAVRDELAQPLGGLLRISIEFCDTLEQTQGGKYRYVVSTVPLDV